MRIPTGNFGNTVAQPQQAVRGADTSARALANAQALQVAVGIVKDQVERVRKMADEEESNRALEASLNHELGLKQAAGNLVGQLERGEITPEDAERHWQETQAELQANTVGKLRSGTKAAEEAYRRAQLVGFNVSQTLEKAVTGARQQRFAADAGGTLDRLGKMAMLPGESLDRVFQMADSAFPELATRGGIPAERATQQLQTWKDGVRFQRAKLDLIGARRDMAALDQFTKRLEDGDLRGALDPDKVTALTKEADTYRFQLQQAAQHEADKREKRAERAITEVTRQIEQALPVSLDGWDALRRTVEGTSFAPDFNRLVEQERSTQHLLRMPINQQQAYVQQREAQLMQQGGTLADRGNLERIKATVARNVKELEEAPLSAAQRLYGRAVQPIDWVDLVAPGGEERAAELFNDRAVTLKAMSRQYGPTVGFKPLLPQEVAPIVSALDKASPEAAVTLFGALRRAIGSDDVYQAAMQQVAADSPVKARAGVLAALNAGVTLERNLIGDDRAISSTKVAQTMLAGEAILNKTRAQKAQDGRHASLAAPSRNAFDGEFARHVADLYRGRPDAQDVDLQSAWAYYVGRAAQTGRLAENSQDVDSKLVKEAIRAVIGDVVDVNGQGHAKAPIGMDGTKFLQKAREAFNKEATARGLPASALQHWHNYGLQNWNEDGTYLLTLGGHPVVDPKTREPIVLDLVWRGTAGRRFGRTRGQMPPTETGTRAAGGAR